MMNRLIPAIAAMFGGFFPRFLWKPMRYLSASRVLGRRKGNNATARRQAIKRRNIAKRLPLKKRR